MSKLETLIFGTIDFQERMTAQLLLKAKRSGYFFEVIRDAKDFESDG